MDLVVAGAHAAGLGDIGAMAADEKNISSISDRELRAYLDGEVSQGDRLRIFGAISKDESLKARLDALEKGEAVEPQETAPGQAESRDAGDDTAAENRADEPKMIPVGYTIALLGILALFVIGVVLSNRGDQRDDRQANLRDGAHVSTPTETATIETPDSVTDASAVVADPNDENATPPAEANADEDADTSPVVPAPADIYAFDAWRESAAAHLNASPPVAEPANEDGAEQLRRALNDLGAHLGMPMGPRRAAAPGLELISAERVSLGAQPAGRIAYRDADGDVLTVYILRETVDETRANQTLTNDEIAGLNAIRWSRGPYGYVVFGGDSAASLRTPAISLAWKL